MEGELIMSKGVIGILAIVTMAIWVMVSREAIKSKENISRGKMITLLLVGTLFTLILIFSFFKNLSY